jgi:tripeptide aminopeptidase
MIERGGGKADISEERALELVTELMGIPGPSGQERLIAEAIERRLRDAGVPAEAIVYDSTPKRSPHGGEVGSLIARLPGTRRGPRRLLMAHIDTVPLCVGSRPVRRGGVIVSDDPETALGGDDRAGASVVLNSVLEILRRGLPHPPLTLFWPVQEEIGLFGARFVTLSKLGRPKLCFNWDGGLPENVTIGATGDYAMRIEIRGAASHAGAHPELGVSAATIAGRAIAELDEGGWLGLIRRGRHTGTSNVGVMHGGDATNVVMPKLVIRAEARSHDPKFRAKIVDAYRSAFERAAQGVRSATGRTGTVTFTANLQYESFRLSEDDPVVVEACRAVAAAGLEPQPRVTNGGLDANWMTAHGLPTVTLGCGQQDIHTTEESLDVRRYLDACRIGLLLATAGG